MKILSDIETKFCGQISSNGCSDHRLLFLDLLQQWQTSQMRKAMVDTWICTSVMRNTSTSKESTLAAFPIHGTSRAFSQDTMMSRDCVICWGGGHLLCNVKNILQTSCAIEFSSWGKLGSAWGTRSFCLFLQKVDYLTYLAIFDQLFDIPKDKKNAAYRE